MSGKQMMVSGALGSSILLVAFMTVLVLAQVSIAGPTVTVYKSPT